ncbi:hypothetical protein QBC47DRAFT_388497 [Echria macrotheca]|uniref:Uncharacterized protein n=1 Tax=Echria macrotheca TaxID=438768 RepID=A0AAJ0F6K1_9PEZI|nr:hypothetical protein QBC47DRAFT_388497 [Echria macrotheca]
MSFGAHRDPLQFRSRHPAPSTRHTLAEPFEADQEDFEPEIQWMLPNPEARQTYVGSRSYTHLSCNPNDRLHVGSRTPAHRTQPICQVCHSRRATSWGTSSHRIEEEHDRNTPDVLNRGRTVRAGDWDASWGVSENPNPAPPAPPAGRIRVAPLSGADQGEPRPGPVPTSDPDPDRPGRCQSPRATAVRLQETTTGEQGVSHFLASMALGAAITVVCIGVFVGVGRRIR